MTTTLTKPELRVIYMALGRLLPPGSLPTDVGEIVAIGDVRDKVVQMFEEVRHARERGKKVFEWRLPRARAPRLNEYAYMKVWMKNRLRIELDDEARRLMEAWPDSSLHGAQKLRWARVTRFSRNKVDDLSPDVLGGKMPLDSLVRVGILHDDSQGYLVREGCCMSTKHGNTHVLIEIFEVADEAVPCDPPKDAPVVQVVRKRGKMTKAIIDAKPPKTKRKKQ